MAAITRHTSDGLWGRRAGDFSGKPEGTGGGPHPVGRLTRHLSDALWGRLAGNFAGKTEAEAEVVRAVYIPTFRPRRRG
jgi:hypothetical protein